jgi:hypothetical protein
MTEREITDQNDRAAVEQITECREHGARRGIRSAMPEGIPDRLLFRRGIVDVVLLSKSELLPRGIVECRGYCLSANVENRPRVILSRRVRSLAVIQITLGEIHHLRIGGITEARPIKYSTIAGAVRVALDSQKSTFAFVLRGPLGYVLDHVEATDSSSNTFAPFEVKRQIFDFRIGNDPLKRAVPPGTYTVTGSFAAQSDTLSGVLIGLDYGNSTFLNHRHRS